MAVMFSKNLPIACPLPAGFGFWFACACPVSLLWENPCQAHLHILKLNHCKVCTLQNPCNKNWFPAFSNRSAVTIHIQHSAVKPFFHRHSLAMSIFFTLSPFMPAVISVFMGFFVNKWVWFNVKARIPWGLIATDELFQVFSPVQSVYLNWLWHSSPTEFCVRRFSISSWCRF